MDSNSRWTTGVIITAVVILAIGGIAYGINKRHHANTFEGEPTTTTSNSDTTSTSSSPATTTTPAQTSTPSCIPASQAASAEGQNGCVQFVGYAYTSYSGQMYLDQSTSAPYGFSVWIPAGTPGGSSLLSKYSGKSIDASGYIQNYKGEPEIEVTSDSQITLAQ